MIYLSKSVTIFKLQKLIPANIIHVPTKLIRPELTVSINLRTHGFVSKMQTLIPMNIHEFTTQRMCTSCVLVKTKFHTSYFYFLEHFIMFTNDFDQELTKTSTRHMKASNFSVIHITIVWWLYICPGHSIIYSVHVSEVLIRYRDICSRKKQKWLMFT